MTPSVIGLDLSLSSTGIAGNDEALLTGANFPAYRPLGWGSKAWTSRITTKPSESQLDRMAWIRHTAGRYILAAKPDLIVVEAPAVGVQSNNATALMGSWWIVVCAAHEAGFKLATVSPSTLKVFATGSGRADKEEMMRQVYRRFPEFNGNNDEADSLWLCALGCERLGSPIVDMPKENKRALKSVNWEFTGNFKAK